MSDDEDRWTHWLTLKEQLMDSIVNAEIDGEPLTIRMTLIEEYGTACVQLGATLTDLGGRGA